MLKLTSCSKLAVLVENTHKTKNKDAGHRKRREESSVMGTYNVTVVWWSNPQKWDEDLIWAGLKIVIILLVQSGREFIH